MKWICWGDNDGAPYTSVVWLYNLIPWDRRRKIDQICVAQNHNSTLQNKAVGCVFILIPSVCNVADFLRKVNHSVVWYSGTYTYVHTVMWYTTHVHVYIYIHANEKECCVRFDPADVCVWKAKFNFQLIWAFVDWTQQCHYNFWYHRYIVWWCGIALDSVLIYFPNLCTYSVAIPHWSHKTQNWILAFFMFSRQFSPWHLRT